MSVFGVRHSYLNREAGYESKASTKGKGGFYGNDYNKPLTDKEKKVCVSLCVLGL